MIKHVDEKATKTEQNNFSMSSSKSGQQQQSHSVEQTFNQTNAEQFQNQSFDPPQNSYKSETFKTELYRNEVLKTEFYNKELAQASFFRDLGQPENYSSHQLIRFPQDKYPNNSKF